MEEAGAIQLAAFRAPYIKHSSGSTQVRAAPRHFRSSHGAHRDVTARYDEGWKLLRC